MTFIAFAAVVLMNSAGTEALLLKRAAWKDLNPNTYSGLGGKLEPGETPDECVVREVSEEAAQIEWGKVTDLRQHLVLTNVIPDKGQTHEMHWFTATLHEPLDDFTSTEGTLHWVPVSDIPLPLVEMSKASWLAIPFMLERLGKESPVMTANLGYENGVPVMVDLV